MKLQYGNCWLGALSLMIRFQTFDIKPLWLGRIIPHFYVTNDEGIKWHFKLYIDILQWPLSFLLFKGYYTTLSRGTVANWYVRNNCTHAHCPDDCEHPQPFMFNNRFICGRCYFKYNDIVEMIPCTPEVCE